MQWQIAKIFPKESEYFSIKRNFKSFHLKMQSVFIIQVENETKRFVPVETLPRDSGHHHLDFSTFESVTVCK